MSDKDKHTEIEELDELFKDLNSCKNENIMLILQDETQLSSQAVEKLLKDLKTKDHIPLSDKPFYADISKQRKRR